MPGISTWDGSLQFEQRQSCVTEINMCVYYIYILLYDVYNVTYYNVCVYPTGSMYGIYANIWGILLMVDVSIYTSTMDPMGYINTHM